MPRHHHIYSSQGPGDGKIIRVGHQPAPEHITGRAYPLPGGRPTGKVDPAPSGVDHLAGRERQNWWIWLYSTLSERAALDQRRIGVTRGCER
jgi:hypothetical protein